MAYMFSLLLRTALIVALAYLAKTMGAITTQGGFAVLFWTVAFAPFLVGLIWSVVAERRHGP